MTRWTFAQSRHQNSLIESWTIFLIFLRLGCTSFGGPIAHLGYFRQEFVQKRSWFTETAYADLVALCQFLPGPSSSQVGIAIGFVRGGWIGSVAAWIGFTGPSAIVLILLAIGMNDHINIFPSSLIHALKIVAVAVIAQAILGMARNLCTDQKRIFLMLCATCLCLLISQPWIQIAIIVGAGFVGFFLIPTPDPNDVDHLQIDLKRRWGLVILIAFGLLLGILPLLAHICSSPSLAMFDIFYRIGSFVFGGGHVVLPLLQSEMVPHWIDQNSFLAGYGAAQAVPGPLFSFAAFLGSMHSPESPWFTGILCLFAIYIPSFLLVIGVLPFWGFLRQHPYSQSILGGVNASVVGLLIAAFYKPVWTSAIWTPIDFCIALIAWVALVFWKCPPWLVIICTVLTGLFFL